MSLSGLFTATFAGERCEKSRIVFFFFFLSPVKLGEWRRKAKALQRLTIPAGHRLLCECACVRVRVSTALRGPCECSNPFFLVAPHSRSSPPRIIGAASSPHPHATPSPGPSSKGFTALTALTLSHPFASCTRGHTRAALASQSHL